ncbi:glycosyl hydrolase 53 family protein [Streptomyces longisporoflavus]|uniref:Arabinogalactan endo-beta-1,4-galactanase n=1 Tax=Streptomyces longisporoflavus TaxID=28044 RepID=A0ABW7QSW3_9ACTN
MHGNGTPGSDAARGPRATRRTVLAAALGAAALTVLPDRPASAAATLANGGFESGTTGWSTYGSTAASFAEAGGRTGGGRLSHWSASAYKVETYQYLTGLTDGTYTLTAWARSSGGQKSAYLALKSGSAEQRTHLPPTPNGKWIRLVTSVRVTGGACTVRLYSDANAGNWANFDDITLTPGSTGLPVKGADISSLAKSEDLGGVYRTGSGAETDALAVLKAAGMNYARLRVWVDPADGYCDKAHVLAVAKRVKARAMKLLVDFHYSDTWTDPGAQTIPSAWAGHTYDRLKTDVYDHTYDVLNALKAQGTTADMVQIGNELNGGMLWPTGSTSDWSRLAGLLTAGAAAAKAVSSNTLVALHLANGGDNALYRTWFDDAVSRKVPFDVIGLSFYGYWHGALSDLQANMDDLAARYAKPLFVAETAYPFRLGSDDDWEDVIDKPEELVGGYPATEAGQAAWFRDIQSVVEAVPSRRGLGVFWWDATWTAVEGNGWDPTDPTTGNAWENQALFDYDGVPTEAVNGFAHR